MPWVVLTMPSPNGSHLHFARVVCSSVLYIFE
ncbi:hypothetical protein 7t3_0445 [Salmonella phage 7t3]|nr:hypothetical protein 7t3_0445 [Salmonella phage 7t3]